MDKRIIDNWNTILEDDDTATGGTSHANETLGDFVEEMFSYIKYEKLTVGEVDWYLIDCGIKPLFRGKQ